MTAKSKLLRMDNVLIVVDDLEAAKAFFAELGMELEGETTVEGPWVDRRASGYRTRRSGADHSRHDADPGRPQPGMRRVADEVPRRRRASPRSRAVEKCAAGSNIRWACRHHRSLVDRHR